MHATEVGPSRRRLDHFAPAAVLLVFVGLAVVVGAVGLRASGTTYRDLARIEAGAPVTVDLPSPGLHRVWILHHDYGGPGPANVTVTRDGDTVAVEALSGDLSYETGSTRATALWAFEVVDPGAHEITASSLGGEETFLVGPGDPEHQRERAGRLAVQTGVVGLGASLVLLIVLRRPGRRGRPESGPGTRTRYSFGS